MVKMIVTEHRFNAQVPCGGKICCKTHIVGIKFGESFHPQTIGL